MEEDILKILDDNGYDNDYPEAKDAAKEIATHMAEFFEWKDFWWSSICTLMGRG